MTSTAPVAGFAELYERHYEAVFRAALRVTGNPADAEDVLQTVFLRVLARVATSRTLRSRRPISGAPPSTRPSTCCAGGSFVRRRLYDDQAPHAAVQPPVLLKERLRRAIAHPGQRGRQPVPAASRRGAVDRRAGRRCSRWRRTTWPSGSTGSGSGCRPKWNARASDELRCEPSRTALSRAKRTPRSARTRGSSRRR